MYKSHTNRSIEIKKQTRGEKNLFLERQKENKKSHEEWNQKVGWQPDKNINNCNRGKAIGLNPHIKIKSDWIKNKDQLYTFCKRHT